MPARKRTPADAGALAAGLLVDACGSHAENSLRLEVVKDLALDLGYRLEVLAGEDLDADFLVESALACADLAILAACNLPALPDGDRPLATAAAHLAAGATRALIPSSNQRQESWMRPTPRTCSGTRAAQAGRSGRDAAGRLVITLRPSLSAHQLVSYLFSLIACSRMRDSW